MVTLSLAVQHLEQGQDVIEEFVIWLLFWLLTGAVRRILRKTRYPISRVFELLLILSVFTVFLKCIFKPIYIYFKKSLTLFWMLSFWMLFFWMISMLSFSLLTVLTSSSSVLFSHSLLYVSSSWMEQFRALMAHWKGEKERKHRLLPPVEKRKSTIASCTLSI